MEEEERWEWRSERHAGLCTSNGRWLYVPASYAGCVSMLANQRTNESVRTERDFRRYEQEWEDYGRWNFVYGHRGRLSFPPRRRSVTIDDIVPSFGHFWLYLPRGEDVAALRQHTLG